MSTQPRRSTYTQRRRAIADILDPHLGVASMVPTNVSPTFEPDYFENSLWCSWVDRDSSPGRTLSVSIHRVEDGAAEAESVRARIAEETFTGDVGTEIVGPNPGEVAFVLDYLGDVTAIVGSCVVRVVLAPPAGLTGLVEPALQIARTVGCSPYVDDFVRTESTDDEVTGAWSTSDGLSYDPRTAPQA